MKLARTIERIIEGPSQDEEYIRGCSDEKLLKIAKGPWFIPWYKSACYEPTVEAGINPDYPNHLSEYGILLIAEPQKTLKMEAQRELRRRSKPSMVPQLRNRLNSLLKRITNS